MTTDRVTLRLPQKLADRLRRARIATRESATSIAADAIEHWLTHPLRPGCPDADAARRYYDHLEEQQVKAAGQ
jgi:hypothetical protein